MPAEKFVIYRDFFQLGRNLFFNSEGKLFPYRIGKSAYEARKLELLPKRRKGIKSVKEIILPRNPDWTKDIFVHLPSFVEMPIIDNRPENYSEMKRFFGMSKGYQRRFLSTNGIKTPSENMEGFDEKYLVRPANHFKGKGMYNASSKREAEQIKSRLGEGAYYSKVIPFDKEYRIIFVDGKLSVVLFKKLNEGETYLDERGYPKGAHHERTSFRTVTKKVNDKLRKTSFYKDVEDFLTKYPFHIIAFDVMWKGEFDENGKTIGGDYWVCEVNFAPCVEIETSLKKILNLKGVIEYTETVSEGE